MYYVKFILRNDTKNYRDTNLKQWEPQINQSIEDFNKKDSRVTDTAVMGLVEIHEKYFSVRVDIDERFNPKERSFYTRVGAISRSLKELGMYEILSPHGKLFSLSVEGDQEVTKANVTKKQEEKKEKTIYLDYKNKYIMIPKEMVDEYIIKFY